MHEFEVWDQWVVHVLPEEGGGVEHVEGDAVGSVLLIRGNFSYFREKRAVNVRKRRAGCLQFHQVKLALLGYYLVDVGCQFGVGLDDFAADCALDGRLDFGLCPGGEAKEPSQRMDRVPWAAENRHTLS